MQGKLLFVSTPGKALNPATNEYTYNVMSHLQMLCRKYRGALVVAYDWAGSSSADLRDTPWFNKIFQDEHHDGKTLFMSWVNAQSQDERAAYIDEVEQILFHTMWWASYKGSVKSQIREVCQSGHEAILIRIDGGPITRVEARNLATLIAEARADLKKLGYEDPRIQLDAYETVFQFHAELPRYLARVYGESSRSEDVPSLESTQALVLAQSEASSFDSSAYSGLDQLAKLLDQANARATGVTARAISAERKLEDLRGKLARGHLECATLQGEHEDAQSKLRMLSVGSAEAGRVRSRKSSSIVSSFVTTTEFLRLQDELDEMRKKLVLVLDRQSARQKGVRWSGTLSTTKAP
jgi:hypothetical protein